MAHFPISKVNALRNRAAKACRLPADIPDGWSKSSSDPMKLLAVFKTLRIKTGFVLRAYQFRQGGNGNGIIWAMPMDAPYPEPMECSTLTDRFLDPPKPTSALDELMDAIEGDGTPWSYLSASLFEREACEFGATWHGCNWSTHTILGDDPVMENDRTDRDKFREPWGDHNEWTWTEPKPTNWLPSFKQEGNQITITFLTYSGLGRQSIYRHRDFFQAGSYRSESNMEPIATGPGGFVF